MQKDDTEKEGCFHEGDQGDDEAGAVTLRSGRPGSPGQQDGSSGRSVGGELAFFALIAVLLGYCGYAIYGEFGGRDMSPYKGDHSHEPR